MVLEQYTVQMNRHIENPKVGAPVFHSTRVLDQLRERIRYLHYSLQTEKAYVYWARFFIRWHGRSGPMRHPRLMGQLEVEAFLTMLASERQVSPATHRQALNAILFLYKEVLGLDLPWMQSIGRPPERKRIPVVLTVPEVQSVLALIDGTEGVLARLLYGTGAGIAGPLRREPHHDLHPRFESGGRWHGEPAGPAGVGKYPNWVR